MFLKLKIISGGFMLVKTPKTPYEFIDFREEAPGAAHMNMFKDDPKSAQLGGLAVGIP
jgi:gamma-glutamyltranspeptidase